MGNRGVARGLQHFRRIFYLGLVVAVGGTKKTGTPDD